MAFRLLLVFGCFVNIAIAQIESPCTTNKTNKTYLVEFLTWSIGHQGQRVWTGSKGDELRSGQELRTAALYYLTPDPHNPSWRELVRCATDQEMRDAVLAATQRCAANNPDTYGALEWVAMHERLYPAIKKALDAGDFDGVRSIFSNAQAQNDRVRNTLYCFTGVQIQEFFRRLPPYPPPRPKYPETHKRD